MRFALLCLALSCQISYADFDWTTYGELLNRHVIPGEKYAITSNLVDYQGIAQDPLYPPLLERLALFDSTALRGKKQLAFFINAYNLFAIKLVIDHSPKKSIRDIGSWFSPVWQKPAGVLAGKTISLDTIEHKILRKMNDPRIHFAIVCASMSCPDLRIEAYKANSIDQQLDEQTKAFIANPSKGMKLKGKNIYLSKIFTWFSEDFSKKKDEKEILRFLAQYNLEAGRFSSFDSIEYDWRLNSQ